MTHPRILIRDALITILTPVATAASARLFRQRIKPTSESKLPWINIETDGDTADRHTDQYTDRHALSINVRIAAKDQDLVADVLDTISEQVEAVLRINPTLLGTVESFDYKSSNPDYNGAADVEIAELVLNYECIYITEPSLNGDDFLTLDVDFDMASPRNDPQNPATPDGQIDASATITLPQ